MRITGRESYESLSYELSDAAARAVLKSLCGPIPLQGVTDALARSACGHCAKEDAACTRCHAVFMVQSLAVTEFIRSLAERSAAGNR